MFSIRFLDYNQTDHDKMVKSLKTLTGDDLVEYCNTNNITVKTWSNNRICYSNNTLNVRVVR